MQLAALETELRSLRLGALQRRALEAGFDPAQLEEALDRWGPNVWRG